MIKLSLVIITSGKNKFLDLMLDSLLNLNFQSDVELIIVSSSVEVNHLALLKFSSKQIVLDQFLGYSYSCNVGANHANGQFLYFLNDDIYFPPNCIFSILSKLRSDEGFYFNNIFSPLILNSDCTIQDSFFINYTSRFRKNIFFNKKFFIAKFILKILYLFQRKKFFLWGDSDFFPVFNKEYDHIMGSSILLSKKLFFSGKGFDDRIFLTFEDQLFCFKYAKELKSKCFLLADIFIVHFGNKTIKNLSDEKKGFFNSLDFFLHETKN
jgi:GT2 family glycosyltransferase